MLDENVDPGVLPAQLSSNASVTSQHEEADDDGKDFDINEGGSAELESEQVFCRPDQCSLTNSYVDDNSCLISE
jgi:hypothetical protein